MADLSIVVLSSHLLIIALFLLKINLFVEFSPSFRIEPSVLIESVQLILIHPPSLCILFVILSAVFPRRYEMLQLLLVTQAFSAQLKPLFSAVSN